MSRVTEFIRFTYKNEENCCTTSSKVRGSMETEGIYDKTVLYNGMMGNLYIVLNQILILILTIQ